MVRKRRTREDKRVLEQAEQVQTTAGLSTACVVLLIISVHLFGVAGLMFVVPTVLAFWTIYYMS